MTFKKLTGKLHLWLGLVSGPVVFIVALTGCIYAFEQEIKELTRPYMFVEAKNEPFLPPSEIRKITDEVLPGKHIHGVLYQGNDHAAKSIYYSYEAYYYFVYVNPYTGEVLKVKNEYADFFRFILDGHFYLWLPHEIGQPLVASCTLIFTLLLLSGLFLWWPRSRYGKMKSFKIKWDASWRRKNYDLHSVLGFYVITLAFVLAITGLVWGFEWFRDGWHAALGGEKSLNYEEPVSDTTQMHALYVGEPVDAIWQMTRANFAEAEAIEMHFPETKQSPIHVSVNPDASTYWATDYIYYDRYTLEELPADHIYSRFEDANTADKILRMNYDMHTGAILGLPGKILAFFVSLIVASLPVTGFLIWLGRKKKKTKKANRTGRKGKIEERETAVQMN